MNQFTRFHKVSTGIDRLSIQKYTVDYKLGIEVISCITLPALKNKFSEYISKIVR